MTLRSAIQFYDAVATNAKLRADGKHGRSALADPDPAELWMLVAAISSFRR